MSRIYDRAMAGVKEMGIAIEGWEVEGMITLKADKKR